MWQPIETAPKDGTRILLLYPNDVYQGIITVGQWYADKYSRRTPKPYWNSDLQLEGVRWHQEYSPIAWMPLPSKEYPSPNG